MSKHLSVSYTGPAKTQLQKLVVAEPATFPTVQAAEQWHNNLIDSFAGTEAALGPATKARVRAAAHPGGTVDRNEPEHITVDYYKGKQQISSSGGFGGAWHVYTGR